MFPKDATDGSSCLSYSIALRSNLVTQALGVMSTQQLDEWENKIIDLFFTSSNYFGDYMLPIDYYGYITSAPSVTKIEQMLFNEHGERYIFDRYFEWFTKWDGDSNDIEFLNRQINNDIKVCIKENMYKWKNLLKSMELEFNPLWNVDGTEETVRTLEQDGTVTNAKTGTETDVKTGTQSNAKTGYDTTAKTGTETDQKTGTQTNAKSGTDTLSYIGSETNTKAGQESINHQGTITNQKSVTTTESTTFYDTEKNVQTNNNSDTTNFTGRTDTKSYTNRSDQTTYGGSDTRTDNLTDTLTHNTSDRTDFNSTDTRTDNLTDTLTHNTSDTETRDLLDTERITHRRTGNIGVTTTTKLLSEFREYVTFNLGAIISKDIASYISQGVY